MYVLLLVFMFQDILKFKQKPYCRFKREEKNENNACSLFGVDWGIAFDSSHQATKERRNQKTGRRQMTVYIIVGVIVIIVGSLWLWGAAKIFGTLFSWWLNSDDD